MGPSEEANRSRLGILDWEQGWCFMNCVEQNACDTTRKIAAR